MVSSPVGLLGPRSGSRGLDLGLRTLGRPQTRLAFSIIVGVMWEFPKIRGYLFWSPYNKDPAI